MPRSMTGFGRAIGNINGESFTVELSTVNHRFLDCSFRLPHAWSGLELPLRESIKKYLTRGKVSVFIRREHGPVGHQRIACDKEVARQYVEASRELAHLMHSTDALTLNTLMTLEGVFYPEETGEDTEALNSAAVAAMEDALRQLNAAREAEGAALAADIRMRVAVMREALQSIEERLPELSVAYESRLRERARSLASDAGLSEERIAAEVALMAEKADVNEEVVRLKAHFKHAEDMLMLQEPIGREIGFLTQEIQREINTLGSKMRDIGVTREVLRIKSEIEKLREQAANLE